MYTCGLFHILITLDEFRSFYDHIEALLGLIIEQKETRRRQTLHIEDTKR